MAWHGSSELLLLKPRATQRILESIDARRLVDQPGKTYQSSTGIMAAYTHTVTPENVVEREFLDSGENLPRGVMISYYLSKEPEDRITLSISDAEGNLLREFGSMDDAERKKQKEEPDKSIEYLTANVGWNRFVWDMRLPTSPAIKGKDPQFERMPGPTVRPGAYQLRLQVAGQELTQSISLVRDATSSATAEDLQKQFDLLLDIYQLYTDATESVNAMRRQRDQLKQLAERLSGDDNYDGVASEATRLRDKILEIEQGIFIPDLREGWAGRLNQGTDPLRRLSALPSVVGLGEYPPTEQAYAVFEKLAGIIKARLRDFKNLSGAEIAAFNRRATEEGITLVG